MFIISVLIKTLVQAVALKFAIETAAGPSTENRFATALSVTAGLSLAGLLFHTIPLVGWLASMVLWCAVVMATYRISLVRSVAVAVLQFFIGAGLTLVLKLIGVLSSGASLSF